MSDLKVGPLAAITAPMTGTPANTTSPLGASDPKAAVAAATGSSDTRRASVSSGATQAAAAAPVVQTASLDPGDQPVDMDRVATIRSAIASGHYPLVPAQIGDAMIAAGILLQSGTA